MIQEAEIFSKHLRKKMNPLLGYEKRPTVEELKSLIEESKTYCMITPEMLKLQSQFANVQDWLSKAH